MLKKVSILILCLILMISCITMLIACDEDKTSDNAPQEDVNKPEGTNDVVDNDYKPGDSERID